MPEGQSSQLPLGWGVGGWGGVGWAQAELLGTTGQACSQQQVVAEAPRPSPLPLVTWCPHSAENPNRVIRWTVWVNLASLAEPGGQEVVLRTTAAPTWGENDQVCADGTQDVTDSRWTRETELLADERTGREKDGSRVVSRDTAVGHLEMPVGLLANPGGAERAEAACWLRVGDQAGCGDTCG